MKQCPSCNRTYANDKQKFCTQDGTSLVAARAADAGEKETVRIDSEQLDAEVTKVISQELPRMSGNSFDPYKTVMSTRESTTPAAPPSQPAVKPSPAPPSATVPPATTPAPVPPPAVAPPPAAPSSAAPPAMTTPVTASPPAATPPPAAEPVAAPPAATTLPPPPPQDVSAQAASSSAANEAGQVTLPPPSVQAAAAAAAAQQVQPRRKKSKLPLILGILSVLLLLGAGGVVAGYFFVLRPMLEKKRITSLEPRRAQPTPNVVSTPDVGNKTPETPKVEVPPYSPPAGAVQFVNSNAKLKGKLAEHFVDFSFYYPKSWYKDPEAGTANSTNFAKVQRQLAPDAPQEIFAVGWYSSTGAKDTDEASYARLVTERSARFAKTYPEYQKVSEGPAKAGPYDAYEFHFTGMFRNTERGDVKIWGRVMFVPPLEGTKGVTLLMLASSLAQEVKSVNDVGQKGELPMILESFRFGK